VTTLPPPSEVLPQRPPFLFLDRCCALGESLVVCEAVFDAVPGHFPDQPIVPGVLLLEGLAQTLAYWTLARKLGTQVLLGGADKVRFRELVTPGDLVRFDVSIDRYLMGVVHARGLAFVGDTEVASARLKGRVLDGSG